MTVNKEFDLIEYYDSLRPKRCIGCECLELILFGEEGEEFPRWECELEECYMPNDSYNPEWSPDDS